MYKHNTTKINCYYYPFETGRDFLDPKWQTVVDLNKYLDHRNKYFIKKKLYLYFKKILLASIFTVRRLK